MIAVVRRVSVPVPELAALTRRRYIDLARVAGCRCR
ncbi:putative leader peptide [Embleya sp. AB8]